MALAAAALQTGGSRPQPNPGPDPNYDQSDEPEKYPITVHRTAYFGSVIVAVKAILEMLCVSFSSMLGDNEITRRCWTTGNLFFRRCADTLSA
jgi:hypothetical protein